MFPPILNDMVAVEGHQVWSSSNKSRVRYSVLIPIAFVASHGSSDPYELAKTGPLLIIDSSRVPTILIIVETRR
jgi:hypothetical protein